MTETASEHNRRRAGCRVNLDCQREASKDDTPLVVAARTFFDNVQPSKWALLAMLAPAPILPFVRILSRCFPAKSDVAVTGASNYIHDVCVHLMQVRLMAAACNMPLALQAVCESH